MTALATITRDFNGTPFVFREDGWFNMTKAAKHFGKEVKHFWTLESTTQYLEAQVQMVGKTDLWESFKGRDGATWGHPKLAVFFARWLDVRFAVWCDAMIDDILKGKALHVSLPLGALVQLSPQQVYKY